ncbi:MAG: formate dehydrogenase subunit gamma [Arcobacter sp.]|uniref:formate dehydrogenase subunit gamma n=1 Tax=uncultured Arcobacter sp. TaxID=165434 RepID=UPI000CC7BD3D|nr:formate dehydrogenase subunit gamma [uncultured Arcobacter sp.]PLY10095.1 MAG: formate dehydrogenase subunit gamma [Arcobacter sp.]
MSRIFFLLVAIFSLDSFATVISDENQDLIYNILHYGKTGSLGLGYIFTKLQSEYFSNLFLAIVVAVPLAFFIHYKIIGPKIFSHDKKKLYLFTIFNRTIHAIAAFSFLLIIPTGLVMIFGSFFHGGAFVRICQDIHVIVTPLFLISVIPMFLMWAKDMLFTNDDIKWMKILGGYLSKEKKPIPAGKFNAGQKMWFWVCTLGGILMIITGAFLYFQDVPVGLLATLGLTKIAFLRICIIMHNVLGMMVTALFITHVYMSMFAIKGAVHSIITGYKEEEELEILHSSFYKELKDNKKI